MATDNPAALTWLFSFQVADPSDATAELAVIRPLADLLWVQYLAYHVVEHTSLKTVYIRGIIRCYRPRSLLQLKAVIATASYKPLRGHFAASVVADKLRSTSRIGDLFEFGSITPGAKRSLDCSGLCSCCCLSNKRINI